MHRVKRSVSSAASSHLISSHLMSSHRTCNIVSVYKCTYVRCSLLTRDLFSLPAKVCVTCEQAGEEGKRRERERRPHACV